MKFGGIIRLVALMIVGAAICFMGLRDLSIEGKKAVDLYDLSDWSDLEVNDHVEGDVEFSIGPAVYNTDNGKVTSEIYCLVNISGHNEGATMDQFVGIVVSKQADRSKLNDIYNDSYEWWQGNGGQLPEGSDRYHFDGKIRKMTAKEQEFFEEYIDECNQSSKDLVPYVIVPFAGGSKILVGIGGLFILVPAVIFALTFSKNRSKANEIYEDL